MYISCVSDNASGMYKCMYFAYDGLSIKSFQIGRYVFNLTTFRSHHKLRKFNLFLKNAKFKSRGVHN